MNNHQHVHTDHENNSHDIQSFINKNNSEEDSKDKKKFRKRYFFYFLQRFKYWKFKRYPFPNGRSYVLYNEKKKKKYCMVGPHWWLMIVTYIFSVHFYFYVTLEKYYNPFSNNFEIIFCTLVNLLSLFFYALVSCKDPGIITNDHYSTDQINNNDNLIYCDICELYRPASADHCDDCRCCIEEHDHHCPWTGKCIGKNNISQFYLFILFLILSTVYDMIQISNIFLPSTKDINLNKINLSHPHLRIHDDRNSNTLIK